MTLAVRPEKITLAPRGAALDPALANRIDGRVAQAVYSGSSITYVVEAAGRRLIVFAQNLASRPLAPGTEVVAAFAPEHAVTVRP